MVTLLCCVVFTPLVVSYLSYLIICIAGFMVYYSLVHSLGYHLYCPPAVVVVVALFTELNVSHTFRPCMHTY